MLRTQVVKLVRAPIRSFSVAAVRCAEGDLGGTRSGGAARGDAFSKREAASENKFIKEKEAEALRSLREKLKAQRKHLDELDEHINDMQREQSGEKK